MWSQDSDSMWSMHPSLLCDCIEAVPELVGRRCGHCLPDDQGFARLALEGSPRSGLTTTSEDYDVIISPIGTGMVSTAAGEVQPAEKLHYTQGGKSKKKGDDKAASKPRKCKGQMRPGGPTAGE